MPIEGKSLEAVSRQFCNQLNHLLSKTISQQRLVTIRLKERLNIAFRRDGYAKPVKLRTRFGEMEFFVGLLCSADKIRERHFKLYISEYRYTLGFANSSEPIWRWEYHRQWTGQDDRWCRHHVQGDIPISQINLSLNDLHLPSGYVTIEDIIRFCIVDLRAKPLSPNWHDILEESYQNFKHEPYD